MKPVAPCSVKVKQKSILFFSLFWIDKMFLASIFRDICPHSFFLIICYEEKAAWD